ncbi:MAG: hypothetical protein ACYDC3_10275 [Candidatus Binataceae bacterium]
MPYKKKPSPGSRKIKRIACAVCFAVRLDPDFICELEACPRDRVPITARRDQWEGIREPGVKNL